MHTLIIAKSQNRYYISRELLTLELVLFGSFMSASSYVYHTFIIIVLVQLGQFGVVIFGQTALRRNIHNQHNVVPVFLQGYIVAERVLYGKVVDGRGRFVVNASRCHFFVWLWRKWIKRMLVESFDLFLELFLLL